MVRDAQIKLYRRKRRQGLTQEAAAAAAGMTAKTARKWEVGALPSAQPRPPRDWRTRGDPLGDVWESEVVPLLRLDQKGVLQAKTILEVLCERFPDRFQEKQLRTVQRRLRDWRAVHGPDKEVFFEQEHVPGREAQFDFTDASELGVTIGGAPLSHKFFEFILSFSKWRWASLAFGETYEAMAAGLQGAVWALGGTPAIWRSDNLSAATHQLREEAGRELTEKYKALLEHYDVASTRINVGKSHENGVTEKGHHILKTAVEQALIVRQSSDFATLDHYRAFLDEIVAKLNRKCADRLVVERAYLRDLPPRPVPAYTDVPTTVRKWSCIRVGSHTYSVSSRLIGHDVTARIHPDEVEVLFRGRRVDCFPRLRGKNARRIDYRHLAHSLIKKPGAFAHYRYREDLFPTLAFRRAYDALRTWRGDRADVQYVRLLHLAATTMECEVDIALEMLLEEGAPFEYADVKALVQPEPKTAVDVVAPFVPDLGHFNDLLTGDCHAQFNQIAVSASGR